MIVRKLGSGFSGVELYKSISDIPVREYGVLYACIGLALSKSLFQLYKGRNI